MADYSAPVDPTTLACVFDVPAFAKVGAYTQYWVSFTSPDIEGQSSSFGAGIDGSGTAYATDDPGSAGSRERDDDLIAKAGAVESMSLEMS